MNPLRRSLLLIICYGFVFQIQSQILYSKQSQLTNYFYTICEEPGTNNYLLSNLNYTTSANNLNVHCRPQILKIDPLGHLVDSISLDSGLYSFAPIVPVGNHYYITGSSYRNPTGTTFIEYPVVIKYDLNFHIQQRLKIDSGITNNGYIATGMVTKNNRLYVTCTGVRNGGQDLFSKVVKLDRDLNILDSLVVPNGMIHDLADYRDGLLTSGYGFSSPMQAGQQVAKLDTALQVESMFNLDSLTFVNNYALQKVGISSGGNIVQAGSNSYYITGMDQFNQFPSSDIYYKSVTAIIKNNNQVVHTAIVGRDSVNTVNWSGLACTSKRYNKIYSVAKENGQYFGNLGVFNRMLVHKADTAGNMIWVKYFGGDMAYQPLSVYATADSGFVVSGVRYDSVSPAVLNAYEGFVMKFNKNGEQLFTGIIDHGKLNSNYHNCYPNPSSNEIYFDVPLEQDLDITFYSSLGAETFKTSSYKNRSAIKTAHLASGVYTYTIKTKAGRSFSGKFVKE